MVLRDSGMPSAFRDASERLVVALKETPMDVLCRHALGDCLVRMGAYERAIEVLKPLEDHTWKTTRDKTRPLLEQCYKATGQILELGNLRKKMADEVG
jgi:lipopolysaccharide biosynthesis regulator YciM